ncbi:MAG: 4-(cytidine 5'-diphospho)-2-C-methyl-D-erythritol kinase [Hyphomicrobiales bacterium]
MIIENAWAKLNLALHVTGRREDGYHLLDSLVVFATSGDLLRVSKASSLTLSIDGPKAPNIDDSTDNLVLRAAKALTEFATSREQSVGGAHISLTKCLPVAAGIGGGSADAAATLRALNQLWELNLSHKQLEDMSAGLGADVPVCIGDGATRIRGIGTQLEPVSHVPSFNIVLVNPNISVSTPAIFKSLDKPDNMPMTTLPATSELDEWLNWLRISRNDLFAPTLRLCPEIDDVLSALTLHGARLVRMSGSGATCFGVFEDFPGAEAAAASVFKAHPNWWVEAAKTI